MEKLENFKSLGYQLFSDAIDKEELIKLQNSFDETIALDAKEIRGTYFYLAHELNDTFLNFLNYNPIQKYVDNILSETSIIHSFNGITLKPMNDNPIQNSVHRDTQRFSRDYLLSVQLIIMLDDFTKDNGGTYFLPKSHLSESKPSEELFYKNAVQIEGKAGDIVLFDSLCWHAGGTNYTNSDRRALTLVYTRSFMKQQIDLTANKIVEKKIRGNDKIKRLLGYNVRVPKNIDEFSLPFEERLYKSNQG